MAFSPETRWLHPNYNYGSLGPNILPTVTHTGTAGSYVYPSLMFANATQGIVRVIDLCISNIGGADDVASVYVWRAGKILPTSFPSLLNGDAVVSGVPIQGVASKETFWLPMTIVLQPLDQLHLSAGLLNNLSCFANLLEEL